MIDQYFVHHRLIGSSRFSYQEDHGGIVWQEQFFCPYCGSVWAEVIRFREPSEPRPEAYRWHFTPRPCGFPLLDPTEAHPTFWLAANRDLIFNTLKGHFTDGPACLNDPPHSYTFHGYEPTSTAIPTTGTGGSSSIVDRAEWIR